jgi:hypothetical protein
MMMMMVVMVMDPLILDLRSPADDCPRGMILVMPVELTLKTI